MNKIISSIDFSLSHAKMWKPKRLALLITCRLAGRSLGVQTNFAPVHRKRLRLHLSKIKKPLPQRGIGTKTTVIHIAIKKLLPRGTRRSKDHGHTNGNKKTSYEGGIGAKTMAIVIAIKKSLPRKRRCNNDYGHTYCNQKNLSFDHKGGGRFRLIATKKTRTEKTMDSNSWQPNTFPTKRCWALTHRKQNLVYE